MPRTSARRPAIAASGAARSCSRLSSSAPARATPASAGPVSLRLQVSMTPEELATFQPALAGGRRRPSGVHRPARERPAGLGDPEDHDRGRGGRPAGRAAGDGLQRPAVDPPRRVPRPDRTGQDGRARPDRLLRRPARPVPLARRPLGHPGQRLPGDRLLRQEGVRRCGAPAAGRHVDVRGHADGGSQADRRCRREAPGRRRLRSDQDHPLGLERRRDLLLAGRGHPGPRRRAVRDPRLHDDVVHRSRDAQGVRLVGRARPRRPCRAGRPVRRVADGRARATRSSRARRRWARTARSPSAS